MAAYEVLLLNTAIPQIQAAQSGDTYVVPRDIAFSAALTLSAGTANGVLYLSDPGKVVTSGSALTFDGTNLGIGANPASYVGKLVVNGGHSILDGNQLFLWSSGNGFAPSIYAPGNSIAFRDNNGSEVARLTSTGLKSSIAGSNSDPVFSYTSDTNTGIFFPAADKLGFVAGGGSDQMVLTSTGLGIGVSSPASTLEAYKPVSVTSASNQDVLTLTTVDTDGGYYYAGLGAGIAFRSGKTSANAFGPSVMGAIYGANSGDESVNNGYLSLHTRSSGTVAERARIDSSGTLILRQSSNSANTSVSFNTTVQDALTLDSSGNLLVGTATSNGRLTVQGVDTGSTNAFYISNSTPALAFRIQNDGYINTGTLGASPYNNTTASAANLVVDSGGGLSRSTSSLKYKRDVKDSTHGLTEVMALRSVTYKGKSEADGEKVFGGLIAEEVHAAGLSEFVQYAEDGSPDALAYGNMVSLCIKAIQEQQAMINELKAEVAALKGA